MTIWFTSDTHFNHENIITYSSRPFRSLEEMTEELIRRWNVCVNPGDTVYHLGDFALTWGKKHASIVDGILWRLHGQKWLIVGNHDRKEVTQSHHWHKVCHYHELKADLGGIHKQRIILSHYAMRTWNQMHRGSWMLHGHSHGSLVDIGGKTMDVGVDCHAYAPLSLEEVDDFMRSREIAACDHHVTRVV